MATVFYRPQALETIARRTLNEYDPMYLNGSPRAVPIETIIEKTFGLRIEYQYLTNDARELGRMIYDSGITTYYDRDRGDYALMRVEDATEWQANYLAKAILMPNGQVKRCFYALRPVCRSKSEYVCKMAEIFEVSKQAMEIRLKEFALI